MVAMDLILITLANFLILLMTLAYKLAAAVVTAASVAVVVAELIELLLLTFVDNMCSWWHHLAISHHYGIPPPVQLFRVECNCHQYPIHDFRKIDAAKFIKLELSFLVLHLLRTFMTHLSIFIGYVLCTTGLTAQYTL